MALLLFICVSLMAVVWASALIFYDVRFRRLPDFFTLPAGAVMMAWTILESDWHGLWGLLWPVLYFALALLSKGNGIGGGDIKLALPLGIAIALSAGVQSVLIGILMTSLIALPWGLVLRWRRRHYPVVYQDPPNGPGMLVATAIVLFTPL